MKKYFIFLSILTLLVVITKNSKGEIDPYSISEKYSKIGSIIKVIFTNEVSVRERYGYVLELNRNAPQISSSQIFSFLPQQNFSLSQSTTEKRDTHIYRILKLILPAMVIDKQENDLLVINSQNSFYINGKKIEINLSGLIDAKQIKPGGVIYAEDIYNLELHILLDSYTNIVSSNQIIVTSETQVQLTQDMQNYLLIKYINDIIGNVISPK